MDYFQKFGLQNFEVSIVTGQEPKGPEFVRLGDERDKNDASGSRTEKEEEIRRLVKNSEEKERRNINSDEDEFTLSLGLLSTPQSSVCHLWNSVTLEPYLTDTECNVKMVKLFPSSVNPVLVTLSPTQGHEAEQPSSSQSSNVERDFLKDDNLIYCDECNNVSEGGCSVHPLWLVRNDEIKRDGFAEDRANFTIPWPFFIFHSVKTENCRGVWTASNLPKGLVFGPYEGRVLNKEPHGEECEYQWRIRDKASPWKRVDAVDRSVSNWLRYIQRSLSYDETNLVAFQYKGEIYYKTVKKIVGVAELIVRYGDECGVEQCHCSHDHKESSATRMEVSEISRVEFDLNSRKETHEIPSGKKTYKCPWCDRVCNNTSHFQRHLRIHTEEKPYKCPHCQKAFIQEYNLKTHLRIHTGEKPFKCHCKKSFNALSNFKRHSLIHTGERPYKCDLCSKTFNQSSRIKRHVRTHSGEKPYKCLYCDKAFACSSNRKAHLRIHTRENI